MEAPVTEAQLIDLAIDRNHRGQFHSRLNSRRTRARILGKLNHCSALDPHRTTWYNSMVAALRDAKVPNEVPVYLISAADCLDQQSMTMGEAVDKVKIEGWGTLIGVSGHLAIYYAECGERAALIRS